MNRVGRFREVLEVLSPVVRLNAVDVIDLVLVGAWPNEGFSNDTMNTARCFETVRVAEHYAHIAGSRMDMDSQDASLYCPAARSFTPDSSEVRNGVILKSANGSPFFPWQGAEQCFRWIGRRPLALRTNQVGLAGRLVADGAGQKDAADVSRGLRIDFCNVTKLALRTIRQLQTSAGAFVLRMLPAFGALNNRQRAPRASAFGTGLELHLGGLSHD